MEEGGIPVCYENFSFLTQSLAVGEAISIIVKFQKYADWTVVLTSGAAPLSVTGGRSEHYIPGQFLCWERTCPRLSAYARHHQPIQKMVARKRIGPYLNISEQILVCSEKMGWGITFD